MSFFVVILLSVLLVLTVVCLRLRTKTRRLQEQTIAQADACHRSQASQDLMFLANPHPMWIYDRNTLRFLQVNDAAIRSYGYSRGEFVAMTTLDIRPAEDVPVFLSAIRKAPTGYKQPGISRHRRKDGSLLMAEITAFQYDKDNESREMVLALDVTERCRMEEALRESEAGLKALIDNAPFGIAQGLRTCDSLRTVNPALLQILGGYSLEEARQLSMSQQVYADRSERDRLLDVLRRSGRVEGWETNFRRRDGSLVPVRITSTITGGGDSPEVFSSYIEDMTQQTRLEQ